MNIGEICTREVVMVDWAATLQQAASLMRENHVGTLLVTGDAGDGVQVQGILTDRDIVVEAVARGLDVSRAEVGPFASPGLVALPEDAGVGEAISLMKERGVRRLLVSGEDGALNGIVSFDDLLGALGHEVAELAHAARRSVERETAERQPFAGLLPPEASPLRITPRAFL